MHLIICVSRNYNEINILNTKDNYESYNPWLH